MVASVPLLPKRHISTGKRLQISSASSHSISWGMPNMVPVESRFSTAFITAGWQCPAISAPKVRLWSMYSLPSRSRNLLPLASFTKIGQGS